ncbi:MAG: type I restriction enzyme HsdR N-terminal domain-containing protein [Chloroflexi bacterium]|nr:type I restriction enzyme HsdR N-terminal domain-containing protein [Chloroflexota bacterium]MCI0725328.1 type I restriction enzyme HsdR N-terminal domain-containing protein [Chloroflexota bacterium]
MDFIDKIRELAARVPKQLAHIQTEEATKNALVMPFIAALGYNVFDPTEVTPELNADVGIKKGEKVDYAILKDGQPIMLFECKHHTYDLDVAHASQLYRYFSVTQARFGILTNGIMYRFFTDLEAPNKLDSTPFFEFNLLDFKDRQVEELKQFTKPAFDVNKIMTTASELKYTRAIKKQIATEVQEPSDELVRYFTRKVYPRIITQPVKEQFTALIKQAFQQYISERVSQRLESALVEERTNEQKSQPGEGVPSEEVAVAEPVVVTTGDELEGYYIVKAILRDIVDPKRMVHRDAQSYFGILLDNNNRKPICRLHFNRSQKYLGLFDKDRKEEKVPINSVDDIYQYADRLKATIALYE